VGRAVVLRGEISDFGKRRATKKGGECEPDITSVGTPLMAYECRLPLVRAMKFHVPPAAMGCSSLGAEVDQRPSDPSVIVVGFCNS
jgi:hypothetical protein